MYGHQETDLKVEPFLAADKVPQTSWLKLAREALLLSKAEVARRANLSSIAYSAAETREGDGKITLAQLSTLAEALDCELVYAIRPRAKTKFSEVIWNKLWPSAAEHPAIRFSLPHLKPHALASEAIHLLSSASFRKQFGWSPR